MLWWPCFFHMLGGHQKFQNGLKQPGKSRNLMRIGRIFSKFYSPSFCNNSRVQKPKKRKKTSKKIKNQFGSLKNHEKQKNGLKRPEKIRNLMKICRIFSNFFSPSFGNGPGVQNPQKSRKTGKNDFKSI